MKKAAKIARLIMIVCLLAGSAVMVMAQGSYRAQIRGVVQRNSLLHTSWISPRPAWWDVDVRPYAVIV
jgi:hypothetical protein